MELYEKLKNYNRHLYFVNNKHKEVRLCLELKNKKKLKIKYIDFDTFHNIKIKADIINPSNFSKNLLENLGFSIGNLSDLDNFLIIKCNTTEPKSNCGCGYGCLFQKKYQEIIVITTNPNMLNTYLLYKYTIYKIGIFTDGYYDPIVFHMENT
jgi:hypothetical protein